jgi:hypothetical protein
MDKYDSISNIILINIFIVLSRVRDYGKLEDMGDIFVY